MFEWDTTKRISNSLKHGVDFAEVARFDWNSALVVQDTRFDYGEDRFQALGMIGADLHMLVFTPRGKKVRIISLRLAVQKEIDRYGKSKKGHP